MNTLSDEDNADDEYRAVEYARGLAFQSLVEDAGGSEDKANELFTALVVKAFAQHFYTSTPDEVEEADRAAVLANADLQRCGAAYRLVGVRAHETS